MRVCNSCWFILDEQGNRIRAMLPNDDSKFNEMDRCPECKADDLRFRGLYLNAWTRRQNLPAPATVRGDR